MPFLMFSRRYYAFRRLSLHIDDSFLTLLLFSFILNMVLQVVQSRLDITEQPV